MNEEFFAAISSAIDYGTELTIWAQSHGLYVVVVSGVAFFGYRVLRRILDRSFRWRKGKETGRRATLHGVAVVAMRVLFVSVTILLILPEFGLSTGPLIASLGIFGLAFSFGAQSLVRDVVSGFFLLAEDLCRVGEEVKAGEFEGRVEGLRLRTLVLREKKGSTVFLPYGEIKSIVNYSRTGSAST